MLLLMGGVFAGLPPLPHYAESQFATYRIAARGTAGIDLIDSEGTVAARYGSGPAAYLIRPDGRFAIESCIS